MSPDVAFVPSDRPVVLVPVAQLAVMDHLAVDPRTQELDARGAERVLTATDREAMAAALALRDAASGFLVAVAIDDEGSEDGLREALALGADAALLLAVGGAARDALTRATILAEAARQLPRFDLVVMAAVSDDPDWGLVPGALAHLLECPVVPAGRGLGVQGDTLSGTALFGARPHGFEAELPAVVSVRPGSHATTWPTAWRIADAFGALPVVSWSLADLDADGRLLSRLSAPAETRSLRVVRPEAVEPERFTDPPEASARTLGKRLARQGYLGGF